MWVYFDGKNCVCLKAYDGVRWVLKMRRRGCFESLCSSLSLSHSHTHSLSFALQVSCWRAYAACVVQLHVSFHQGKSARRENECKAKCPVYAMSDEPTEAEHSKWSDCMQLRQLEEKRGEWTVHLVTSHFLFLPLLFCLLCLSSSRLFQTMAFFSLMFSPLSLPLPLAHSHHNTIQVVNSRATWFQCNCASFLFSSVMR